MKTSINRGGTQLIRPGFTLIEIITVVAIIAILATMSVTGFQWYLRKAKIGRAEIFIKSVDRALEEYATENGSLPTGNGNSGSTADVYTALYGDLDGDGKTDDGGTALLATLDPNLPKKTRNVDDSSGTYVLIDPWGEEYLYQHPGQMNPPGDFDLWSLGPDGEGGPTGTEKERADDAKNW